MNPADGLPGGWEVVKEARTLPASVPPPSAPAAGAPSPPTHASEHGRPVGPTRGPGSVEGKTFEYRRVWIEPFVKGPENAPLVIRDHVGVLNR